MADRAARRYDRKSGYGGVVVSELQDKRVAVLIDAENIASKHIDEILDKASHSPFIPHTHFEGFDFAQIF